VPPIRKKIIKKKKPGRPKEKVKLPLYVPSGRIK
jgi:hypothetical protein